MILIKNLIKSYQQTWWLLLAIVIGIILGLTLKDKAVILKPLGDIFLNLLFTVVVLLVFFSLSSVIALMKDLRRLGVIASWMMGIFILTGTIAALVMVLIVSLFPPAQGLTIALPPYQPPEANQLLAQIAKSLTVSDFVDLLSKKNMLALIIFSILVGIAANMSQDKAKPFTDFLHAGNEVMSRVVVLIMYYAPIGLGAYFAYLVGNFGPELLGTYSRVMLIYYPVAIGYFFIAFSIYACIAGGLRAVVVFWQHIPPVALTALATGSSIATIPSNLETTKKTGINPEIADVVIPMGATIHMEGSALSAILKIALLFGIYQMPFEGAGTIATAVGIALLSATVMSGISGGGFLGEMLIVTMYGFPLEALPIISLIGTLVDPPATMVNAVGDHSSAMMITRFIHRKKILT